MSLLTRGQTNQLTLHSATWTRTDHHPLGGRLVGWGCFTPIICGCAIAPISGDSFSHPPAVGAPWTALECWGACCASTRPPDMIMVSSSPRLLLRRYQMPASNLPRLPFQTVGDFFWCEAPEPLLAHSRYDDSALTPPCCGTAVSR